MLHSVSGKLANLSVNHVRDHHDLVRLCIRELQRQFGCLYVKSQHNWILKKLTV